MAALTQEEIKRLLGENYVDPTVEEPRKEAQQIARELKLTEETKTLFSDESEAIRQEAWRMLKENPAAAPEELLYRARTKLEKAYGQPLTPGFDKKEFPSSVLLPEPATPEETGLAGALRPQIRAGSAAQAEYELQRQAEIGATRVFLGLDESKLAELPDTERDDIKTFYSGAEAAWNIIANENPQLSGEQIQELLDDELDSLDANLKGEGRKIRHAIKMGGPQDPTSLAFKPQVTQADIPDLSPAQRAFLQSSTQTKADLSIPGIIKDVNENFQVEVEMADPSGGFTTQMHPPSDKEKAAEIERRIGEIVDLPWWATAEKEKTLATMEPRTTFTGGKVYPTGATVESPVAYLFRAALSPLNAATALGFLGLEAAGALPLRERVRQERPEAYKEEDVIVDITDAVARNRSGMAEIGDMWQVSTSPTIRKLAPIGYGAGFVLDLLVPIDLGAAAVMRAGKTGYNVSRLTKQLTGTADWASAWKFAGKQLVSDIPVLRNAVKNSGDFRVLMSAEAGRTLTGYRVLKEATEAGDDFATAMRKVAEEIGDDASFVKSANRAGNADRILADLANSVKLSRYVDDIDSVLGSVSRFASGQSDAGVASVKDMKRWIRVMAKQSSEVEGLLEGQRGLRKMLTAVLEDPNAARALKNQIAWEKGAELVGEMTAGWRNIAKNLVMVTPRTWATADRVPDILKRAHESTIGKISDDLAESTVVSRAIEGEVKTGWELAQELQDELIGELQGRYSRAGLIGSAETRSILSELKSGFLSSGSLRSMVGAEIDLTAQAMRQGFGAKAIERLEPIVQKELLAPMEARSMTSGWFKRHIMDRIAATPVAERGLTINAQRELLDLRRGIASLDKKLRANVARLKNDAAFRELYGIAADVKLSTEDATIHLLMGPDAPRALEIPELARQLARSEEHKQMLETMLDFYVRYMQKTPSIGDIFRPSTFVRTQSFLSDDGADAMQAIVNRASEQLTVTRNGRVSNVSPADFRRIIDGFLVDINAVVKNPKMLRSDLLAGEVSVLGAKHTDEMLATVFYQTEARRAAGTAIENIIRKDDVVAGSERLDFGSYASAYQELARTLGINIPTGGDDVQNLMSAFKGAMERLTVKRGQTRVSDVAELGTTLRRGIGAREEWIEAVHAIAPRATDAQIEAVLKNKPMRIRVGEMASVADDTIEQIIRRNGMASENLSHLLEGMSQTLSRGPQTTGIVTGKLTEASLGRVNAQLIKDSVGEATNLKRLSKYIEGLHKTKGGARAVSLLTYSFRQIQSFRYSLMLGARPRFHGNNTITAPTIIQQTLGDSVAIRASNPLAYAKAADVMGTNILKPGGIRSHKIALVDKAGRIWTYEDVYRQAVESGAMKSRHSFQINQALLDGAIAEARISIKNPRLQNQVIDAIKKPGDALLEMAEIEDNIWRMSVILDSLKHGEDIGVAIQKGRISMYDYGALKPWEQRFASQLFLFYTFSRMNITHTLNNLFHNPNRMKNALVLERDITKLCTGQDAEDLMWYTPDWMRGRPILSFAKGVDKESYYIVGPGIVPVQGAATVAEAFVAASQLDVAGTFKVVTDMLNPELKIILGTGEQWGVRKGIIDPRDVALLHSLGVWDEFQTMIGEEAVGVDPKVNESTFNGRRWVLTDKAWDRYRKLKSVTDYVGATTVLSDATKAILSSYQGITGEELAEGRKLTLGAGDSPAFLEFIGATTPIGAVTPEQELQFGMMQRQRELKEYMRRTE